MQRSFHLTISTPELEVGPVCCSGRLEEAAKHSGFNQDHHTMAAAEHSYINFLFFEPFSWPLTANNMCVSIGLINMVEKDLPPLSVFISYVRYARTNMKMSS